MYTSRNFSTTEWDCYERNSNDFAHDNEEGKLVTENEQTADLFMILDFLRDDNPNWVINTTSRGEKSGYRDETVNRLCGGEENSYHLRGCASDIHIDGADYTGEQLGEMVLDVADELGVEIGLGIYEDWVHVDARGYEARW